jgi:thiamine-phosphate pyrophosphorylase
LRQLRYAIDAGVDIVQIRERDLPTTAVAELVRDAVALAFGTATRILVNDRLDVAMSVGAHGVHLRADSISPAAVRSITPKGFLVGRSVHSAAEARELSADVDYFIAGTVWPSASKPARPETIGLAGLGDIVRAVDVPVLAIGGVTTDRIGEVACAGAAGLAAIGFFMREEQAGVQGCRAVALRSRVSDARERFDTRKARS